MKYYLEINALGDFPKVAIDEKYFLNLKQSRKKLLEGLSIEEKYEVILGNYIDLEEESMKIQVNAMIRENIEYSEFFNMRLSLNIRLINLLSAVRLYKDHIPRHASRFIAEKNKGKEIIEGFFSNEYDSNFHFRFMEALRNYVQHYGLPVHGISTGSEWTDLKPKGLMKYFMKYVTKKIHLIDDGKFKKQIIDEMPEEVDLRLSTRSYIESISNIHENVRGLISKDLSFSRKAVEKAISEYKKVCKQNFVGLYAYAYENDKKKDETPIFLKWDDIRLKLEERNKKLVNLSKRYTTNKIK